MQCGFDRMKFKKNKTKQIIAVTNLINKKTKKSVARWLTNLKKLHLHKVASVSAA